MRPGRHQVIGILCGLGSALIWGGFPVVTRLGVARSSLDIFDITFLRFAVAGAALCPVLISRGMRGTSLSATALMVVGIGAPYILIVSSGLTLAPVELFAAVTPGSMVGFCALLSFIWLKIRPSAAQILATLLIVSGIALAVVGQRNDFGGLNMSVAFFLAGGFLWAIYVTTTKAFAVDALQATAMVSVGSAVFYVPAYFAIKGFSILDQSTHDVLVRSVYQGIFVSIVALFFFSKCVELLGAAVGSSFASLVPVIAIAEASIALGERPSAYSIAGEAVVVVGMILSVWSALGTSR